jgi:hypothetical protein
MIKIDSSEQIFKVCLFAEKDVGKKTLSKFIGTSFHENYTNIFGFDILKKSKYFWNSYIVPNLDDGFFSDMDD